MNIFISKTPLIDEMSNKMMPHTVAVRLVIIERNGCIAQPLLVDSPRKDAPSRFKQLPQILRNNK
jgi:hypothetical protein